MTGHKLVALILIGLFVISSILDKRVWKRQRRERDEDSDGEWI